MDDESMVHFAPLGDDGDSSDFEVVSSQPEDYSGANLDESRPSESALSGNESRQPEVVHEDVDAKPTLTIPATDPDTSSDEVEEPFSTAVTSLSLSDDGVHVAASSSSSSTSTVSSIDADSGPPSDAATSTPSSTYFATGRQIATKTTRTTRSTTAKRVKLEASSESEASTLGSKLTITPDIKDLAKDYRITEEFMGILCRNGISHRSILKDTDLEDLKALAPDLGQKTVITNIWNHLSSPPSSKGPLQMPEFDLRSANGNIQFTWSVPNDADHAVRLFFDLVDGTDEWQVQIAKLGDGVATIPGLTPGNDYHFNVKVDPESGYSCPEDKLMPPIFLKRKLEAPANFRFSKNARNSVFLAWDPDCNGNYVDRAGEALSYVVEMKDETDCQWKQSKETSDFSAVFSGLKSNRSYAFRVAAVVDQEVGNFATINDVTLPHFAEEITRYCTSLDPKASPQIFKLPMSETMERTDDSKNIRVLDVCLPQSSAPHQTHKREKVILVVGETGVGKTTFIDGLANYICGVTWSDPFRFKLVTESSQSEKNASIGDQSCSQTRYISAYRFPYCEESEQLQYAVTVIDTPGFGDTGGIMRDKEIETQVRDFFQGDTWVDHVDLVCFIIQASSARLTPSQQYVFNAILSLFGKDIGENFMVLFTFADGQKPPAIAAMEKAAIPCQLTCKMNNSALYASNGPDADQFDKMFWERIRSFTEMFQKLDVMKSKSLKLTQEVLNSRNQLQIALEGLQTEMKQGLAKLNACKREWEVVTQQETLINENKNFTYTTTDLKIRKETYDTKRGYDTNCLTCNRTCHYPCSRQNDEDKANCMVMTNGVCRICPGKCHWSVHHNCGYKIVEDEIVVTKEYKEMKQKYQFAISGKIDAQKLLHRIKIEFGDVQRNVFEIISQMRDANNTLKEIALRPDPLSSVQHIELLIESEKQKQNFNWQLRVQNLEMIKTMAHLHARATADGGFDPWEEWKKDPSTEEFLKKAIVPLPTVPQRGTMSVAVRSAKSFVSSFVSKK